MLLLHTIGYLCLALAWLIPDHIPPWNTAPQEAIALLGMLLLWPWSRPPAQIPWRLYVLAGVWIAIALLQFALQRIDLGDFLWALLLAVFGCMAASLGALSSPRYAGASSAAPSLQYICMALLAAALVSSVIGLAQWLGVVQGWFMHPSNGRVFGNLAQPNHLASLLVTALAALVYLDGQRLLRGALLYCMALLLAFMVAASESRTGALSITVLTLGVALSRGPSRASLRWLIPALVLFWLCYALWQPISSWVGGSASRTGAGLNSAGRFELWLQMVAAVAEKPWWGWGWMNVGAAQQAVAPQIGGVGNMHHAHNLFLDLVVWFGMPLGGLITLAALGWGWQVLCAVLRTPASLGQATAVYCALLLLPIAVHSMLEYPLAYLYFFLVFAFFAGALEASLGYAYAPSLWTQCLGQFVSVAALACAAWMTAEYSRVEADFRALRLEQTFITQAQELHIYGPPPMLLTQYGTLLRVMQLSPLQVADEATLEEVRHSAQRFPWFLTMERYYLVLLGSEQCSEASHLRQVIASLFGSPGLAHIENSVHQFQMDIRCQQTTGVDGKTGDN